MTYKPDICLYHADCNDGFAAAWVVNSRWDGVDFEAVQYGKTDPLDLDIAGRHVLIVDFSFPADKLLTLQDICASVLVLDHHKTAQEALAELTHVVKPDSSTIDRHLAEISLLVEFDMDRSGAMMAWNFCYPGEPAPMIVQMVQDRDLWQFKLPKTKMMHLYLALVDRTFKAWDKVSVELGMSPHTVFDKARAVEAFYEKRIAEMVEAADVSDDFFGFQGVPVAHVPYYFASDVAHTLLQSHPDAPFAAIVVNAYGGQSVSLRSTDDRYDVSKLAREMGGGGHRNAAGFRYDEGGL